MCAEAIQLSVSRETICRVAISPDDIACGWLDPLGAKLLFDLHPSKTADDPALVSHFRGEAR
jgi:hypothetical protein